MTSPSAGRLPHVDRWSRIGLIATLAAGAALLIADAVVYFYAGRSVRLIDQPFHSMAMVGLAVLAMTCVIVQVGVQIRRGQRRIEAQLDRITGGPGTGPTTAEDIDTRVVQLAGRIAGKITT